MFSFKYGIDIMEQMGIPVKMIHAGHANMFLSSIFRDTLAGVTGATIELYDTDGSVGAAKGAGIGAGIYKDNNEAFATLEKLNIIAVSYTHLGNLSYNVKESDLRNVMEEYGTVASVKLITDRETRRSKGFAFVEMPDDAEANNVIKQLNGAEYVGRSMVVKEALPKN